MQQRSLNHDLYVSLKRSCFTRQNTLFCKNVFEIELRCLFDITLGFFECFSLGMATR